MRKVCMVLNAILLGTSGAVAAESLAVPEPPRTTVVGSKGFGKACYWVVAATGDKFTTPSRPARLHDVPGRLNESNYVSIRPEPVAGAEKYYILKTAPLPEPSPVVVERGSRGRNTYYYWIVVCNGFRASELYGPYPVKRCGEPEGNVISWTPLNGASWYHLYRTESAEPPVGRGYHVVGLQVGVSAGYPNGLIGSSHKGTRVVDRNDIAYGVAGYSPTPIEQPPLGDGMFLVGQTHGEPVKDSGQPLRYFLAQNVNETEAVPVTRTVDGAPNIRDYAMTRIDSRSDVPHVARPSYISNNCALDMHQVLMNGGMSEYSCTRPQGSVGWKSTAFMIFAQQTSHWASQHGVLGGYQRNYGSGDTIYLAPQTMAWGSNKDGGDEGVYSIRADVQRMTETLEFKLTKSTPRGGVRLATDRRWGGNGDPVGSGRLAINASRAHRDGRITRVGNTDVHGKGVRWTEAMTGRWISFDVDTVKGQRMWYHIREVVGPTELSIVARTSWNDKCNLGYSRFIWDPATASRPSPAFTNQRALRHLPPEHEDAARQGAYTICPGTLLDNKWTDGSNDLLVEPVGEQWRAGSTVQIAPGPQMWPSIGLFQIWGNYLPQDDVGGITLINHGNRATNAAALKISHPGSQGFREAVHATLSRDGNGDGVVVSAASGWNERGLPSGTTGAWRGAFVAPVNMAALTDEHRAGPYLAWEKAAERSPTLLQIRQRSHNRVLAQFDDDGVEVRGRLKGSARTRGKAVFDGDGRTTSFTVRFGQAFSAEPFVTVSTNQFAANRLSDVKADHVTVEFQTAPEAGRRNVVVWWMAQE